MRAALAEFLSRLKSIEGTIELRDRLVEFGRVPPGHLVPAALLLRRRVREIGLSGLQPSLDGSVLLTAAAFEQFVWDLIVALAESLPEKVPAYHELPRSIRSANETHTGEALNRYRSRFGEYELRQLVSNLRDCHAGVTPYILNGQAIALNDRNLTAATLRDMFSRVGIDDIWTVVASTRTLQRWSGPGGAKTARSRAINQLNELINDRNQIAHRVGITTLGPQAILLHMEFCRALARSLVKGLEDHANSLVTSRT